MINKQWLEDVGRLNTFNWTDLHGKDLKIVVELDYDCLNHEETTVVTGYEESTGHFYVLHNETERV
jgi:hypothetical protein